MLRLALTLVLLRCGLPLPAQDRALPFRPVVGINIGVGLPKLEQVSGAPFTAIPFLAGTLDIGLSWVYRERVGVMALGVLAINGYDFRKGDVEYDLYHLTQRAEMRAFLQRGLNTKLRTSLRAGLGLGLALQGDARRDTRVGNFQALTTATAMQRSYLAPEVCLVKQEGRHRVEAGLRYVTHLHREIPFTTRLGQGADTTIATARHDHLALVIRFHFGLQRPKLPRLQPPPIDLAQRRTDTLATIPANKPRVTLWLWDNAEFDGDTLSVFLNGIPVLVGHELTRRRHKLRLDLQPGENVLHVVAHNEGRVAPNTARAVMRAGKGPTTLLFATSLERNQALRIVRHAVP
jgi:hypothetical protein